MRPPAARLAWSLAGLYAAMFVAVVALSLLSLPAGAARPSRTVGDFLLFVPFTAFPIVGALIASRRPRNPIGWICLADGLLWMLIVLGEAYGNYGLAEPWHGPVPRDDLRAAVRLAVGARCGAARHLLAPAVPRRAPSVEKVAPACPLVGGGYRAGERSDFPYPRSSQGTRGAAQPVWVRRAALAGCRGLDRAPFVAPVHARFGGEPRRPLPARQRRGTPADQVDSLCGRFHGSCVPDYHGLKRDRLVDLTGGACRPGRAVRCGARSWRT